MLVKLLATELHRRWLDVSDAEYNRRMRARERRNDNDGCGVIILIIIIATVLKEC